MPRFVAVTSVWVLSCVVSWSVSAVGAGQIGDNVISCTAETVSAAAAERCPSGVECAALGTECLQCNCTINCRYGSETLAVCTVPSSVDCEGPRNFSRNFSCRFCYQTEADLHRCSPNSVCNSVAEPSKQFYRATCKIPDHVGCLGRRSFLKLVRCNWTGGYKWTTALALSVTLGGFGADRFYLGHWREGIGKLFSFGGLGVWTLVDVVMVAVRYVGPADGSLYV